MRTAADKPVPGRTRLAVLLLLTLHLGLALRGIAGLGVTHDETAHLTAGYAYWHFNDYRLQPENGNLPQRWGALPLLASQPHLDPADAPELWRGSEVWLIADRFFFGSGNPIDTLLWRARVMMLCWSVALGWLVFRWSRRLWGDGGALLSLGMYAVSPTMLAHGPLVTSDMTAAFWLLAATGAWWRALRNPRPRNTALSAAATALAFVAKFSCVLLGPVFALLAVWHVAERRRTDPATTWPEIRRTAVLAGLQVGAVWVTIWLFFGLRFGAAGAGLPPIDKYFLPWDQLFAEGGVTTALIRGALQWKLLPEAYLEGFAHVLYQGSGRNAFLWGEIRTTGWWWFFPATFWLKSTVAELLLAALGLLAIGNAGPRLRELMVRLAPLLVFGAVYGGSAMLSPLNIGHRHVLPLYPVLFMAGGGVLHLLPAPRRRWLALLPVWSGIAAWSVAPHFLTFFNAPAGGPTTAWRKLVDSSLDWGQGLPALVDWLETERAPNERLYVSYFGNDSLAYRLPDAIHLAPIYEHYRPRQWAELEPGLYVIGATMLQDVYSPAAGSWTAFKETRFRQLRAELLPTLEPGEPAPTIVDYGRGGTAPWWELERLRFNRLTLYLRLKPPTAVIANCMMAYRLSATELRVIESGTATEMANLMAAALDEAGH